MIRALEARDGGGQGLALVAPCMPSPGRFSPFPGDAGVMPLFTHGPVAFPTRICRRMGSQRLLDGCFLGWQDMLLDRCPGCLSLAGVPQKLSPQQLPLTKVEVLLALTKQQ